MLFATAVALVAAASVAHAQSVTINTPTIAQCATNALTYSGSNGPYYVAVLNHADLCGDALAEFYNVDGTSVDYFANIASGTQVQVLVVDGSDQETYSEVVTVGDGDAACLTGATSSSSSVSESATPSDTPASYTPPARTTSPAAAMTYTGSSNSNSNNNDSGSDDTPVNAQSDSTTSGATTVTASASLLLGAVVAVAALF